MQAFSLSTSYPADSCTAVYPASVEPTRAVSATAARDAERLQLARDLHDGPLQELYALGHSIDHLLERYAEDTSISRVRDVLTNVIEELRGVCECRRPHVLEHFGLMQAISHLLCRERSRRREFMIRESFDGDLTDLGSGVRYALFRVCQEALNNVARHAKATRVEVRLRRTTDEVRLTVRDDGQGFAVHAGGDQRPFSLGLSGMFERAASVGGRCAIYSEPGRGTLVSMVVPIQQSDSPA